MRLHDFDALSFDCYGTLIDWETGILAELRPWAGAKGLSDDAILEAFGEEEARCEAATPDKPYPAILADVHRALARRWGLPTNEVAPIAFGGSVGRWPAFPDSAEALGRLSSRFRLVILSNVDHRGIAASLPRLEARFDAVMTAQDVGAYKPDPRNFAALIARVEALGFQKQDILHTAQSLFHDHAPANAAGLASCWIDRRGSAEGWGATAPPPEGVHWDFRFNSLAAMADAVEKEAG